MRDALLPSLPAWPPSTYRDHCTASSIQLPMRALIAGLAEVGNTSEATITAHSEPRMISSPRATAMSKICSGVAMARKPMNEAV